MELLKCFHLYKNYEEKEGLKDINLVIESGRLLGFWVKMVVVKQR